MPSFPIIDTHVHLWDPQRLPYSWLKGDAVLDRPYRVEDYQRDTQSLPVEAMVFLECDVDSQSNTGAVIDEIEFVEEEAKREPRIKAIVAKAPLERGVAIEPLIENMVACFPALKGIRRILQSEADPRATMLSASFVAGVNLLQKFDLHFEITVDSTQMDSVLEFVEQTSGVPMILDHCGKPGIKAGQLQQYKAHLAALAQHPNVVCKLSGLCTEADRKHWSERELRPYIDETIAAFGPDRVIYGSDWPVCLLATPLWRWIELLDRALSGLSESDRRKIFRDNANRFYRLHL